MRVALSRHVYQRILTNKICVYFNWYILIGGLICLNCLEISKKYRMDDIEKWRINLFTIDNKYVFLRLTRPIKHRKKISRGQATVNSTKSYTQCYPCYHKKALLWWTPCGLQNATRWFDVQCSTYNKGNSQSKQG